MTTLSPCAALVKTHDRDRFLVASLMPEPQREALYALFAFNHEIAKTRSVVTETQLGLIRLQWWRDAVRGIYDGEVLEHEVVGPLARAIQKFHLPVEPFVALTQAREFDLEDVAPSTMEGLLNYCDFTTTPLLQLVVRVEGGDPDIDLTRYVAVNYALAGVLRSVAFHAKARQRFLPDDLLQKYGQSGGQLYELKLKENFPDLIAEVAEHYVWDLKAESRALRLTNKLSDIYMKSLRNRRYDVLDLRIQAPALKELRLLFA